VQRKTILLGELTMIEVEEAARKGTVVILPVGSVEEHGKHLPLSTDSLQPEYVAAEVASKTSCLVAPAINYGVCEDTASFPGTISVSFDSLHLMVRDVLDELVRQGFKRLIVLSGHASPLHMSALRLAAHDVLGKYERETEKSAVRVAVLSDYDFAYELRGKQFDERDGHGGEIETSRVLAIRPDLVKGVTKVNFLEMPKFEVVNNLRRYWPNGIKGDPSKADAEKGRLVNGHIISRFLEVVKSM